MLYPKLRHGGDEWYNSYMTFTRIDVAIKPSREVTTEALRLSKEINQKAEAYFALDETNYFPHITLYSTEYPDKNLNEIFETVNIIATNTPSFTAAFTSSRTHRGYIDISIKKSQELKKLHEHLVNSLNPFRENHLREKYTSPTELANYSSQQQEYIQTYGYSEVLDAFRPHLTITRLKNDDLAKAITQKLNFPPESFPVTTIAAYSMGSHGTCTKILEEFPLQ